MKLTKNNKKSIEYYIIMHPEYFYIEYQDVIYGFWKNFKFQIEEWQFHIIQGSPVWRNNHIEQIVNLLNKSKFADAEVFIKTMLEGY